ncbi:TPA: amino acid ABC transporter substrate-binding protein [Klebsiella pneumoniae]|jgi:polar amino acid transport system substrate-binding protein|uniref:Arginine ABC transporter n=7 Tax=Klebsiella/Raoultella group TaxID=2890311 RepID=A0A486TDU6_KLEPN|nr:MULTISPECIES: ABC transporter substrate-binding protein [Enterobacterales]EHW7613972.1 amino acid ABC transporter substrate-binding protein [Escherichia coli]MDU3907831.1 ABC transporter substrate-binding protein [Citrobacter portucalensis]NCB86102.1 amino acid ABC transporter substrate-binding protein [Gammaproteobacteria bacterium]HBR1696386.1 amino acid ABC transporter substrate-binding protein [Klebsiella quasipneumoniae subsp. quasipneumoniae]HDS7991288.1 amino acid ABC transporter sub
MKMKTLACSVALLAAISLALPAGAAEKLVVGTEANGIPISFLNPKTHELDGFMLDIARQAAKHAGYEVEFKAMDFSALIPALRTGKIDLIATGMYITEPRKKVIDFTTPVYSYGEGMIVRKEDTKDYTSFKELPGAVVGAQMGTIFIEPLKQANIFKDVKAYDTLTGIMKDVNAGRIKAGFGDTPSMAYYLSLGEYPNVRLVKSYKPVLPGSLGLGVRKDEEQQLAKLNEAIATMQSNGEITALLEKWKLN